MGASKSKPSKKPKKGEVSLLIENDVDDAVHSVIVPQDLLIAHSPVFKNMALSGALKRCRKIKLDNVTVTGLQKILKYIEESSVTFDTHSEALETLIAAREYQIESMETICINHLVTALDSNNASEIFEYVLSTPEQAELTYRCLNCIDKNAEDILKSSGFCRLRQETVIDIVKRHTLNVGSEMEVFKAVFKWACAECDRKGLNSSNLESLEQVLRPVIVHVRFMTMSKEELAQEEVNMCYDLLGSTDLTTKGRPSLQRVRSSTVDTMNLPRRSYVASYTHSLDIYTSPQHSITNGEKFSLTLEMLKGKMYLIGINLAIDAFVPTKTASCLYVVLTATNVDTTNNKTVRGAFLSTSEEASLVFSSPLPVKVSERVVIALNVKRAENVRPSSRRNEVEIVMPETKDIGFRVLSDSSTENYVRCIFKDITYFF